MSAPSTTRPTRRRRSRLALLVVIGAVTLATTELLVRVLPVEAFSLEAVSLDPKVGRYDAHPYLAYALKPSWSHDGAVRQVSHNSLGFRGAEFARQKPNGSFRIACLGGSSTYGQAPTRDAATWPARLEQRLREARGGASGPLEVINAGAPGYTSFESLVNLALRVLDLEPDVVLVYHGFNDQRCWFRRDHRADNSHARAVWPVERRGALARWLEHSRAFLVARRYLTDFADRRRLAWWTLKDFGVTGARRREHDPDGPRCFARNLEHIVALCRARGVDVALGVQAGNMRHVKLVGEREGIQLARDVVRGVGRTLDVPVLDLDAALGQDPKLFADGVHLSDAGADRLAASWASFLDEQALLPPR